MVSYPFDQSNHRSNHQKCNHGKFLATIGLLFLILSPNHAKADFGSSCVPPPIADSSGYLTTSTAFGYLLSNIDMISNVDGCSQNGNILQFCLKTSSGNPVCTPVQMNAGDTKLLSDLSQDPQLGGNPLIANLPLTAGIVNGYLCLQMQTSRGQMPIICRQYSSTSNLGAVEAEVCQNLGASCYDGRSKSQSLLSFTGLTVNCVQESLDKIFYTGNLCPNNNPDLTSGFLSPFPSFQAALQTSVMAALIMYVMFFGFKIILNNEYAQLNNIATFVLKFIFVLYFSIGIPTKDQNGSVVSSGNGMTNLALPLLLQLTSDFTDTVFLAGGSQGLCVYDPTKYQPGYEFYQVWDAVDCRIGYYFGLQLLYNIINIQDLQETSTYSSSGNNNTAANISSGNNGPATLKQTGLYSFFTVIFGFLMSGNIIIVISGMLVGIMFLSIVFYFVGLYMTSMVTLYLMTYISPIFVPMLLFERTKSYFDSWLKIVISCGLQPAVVGGYIAILLTVYDSVFYGNCEYLRHDYEVSGFNFSTFEIRIPDSDPQLCTSSAGFKLIQYYAGQGWEKRTLLFFEVLQINDFLQLGLSMLCLLIFIFIFYYALKSINEFVSELTGGPSMASVNFSATGLVDAVINMASGKSKEVVMEQLNNDFKTGKGQNKGEQAEDKVAQAADDGDDKNGQGQDKNAGATDKVTKDDGAGSSFPKMGGGK